MPEKELMPCPFCGATIRIIVCDDEGNIHNNDYENDPWSGLGYMLYHDIADVGARRCPIAKHEGEGIMGVWIYDTREDAIKAWNDRYEGGCIMTERERLYELIVDADNEFFRETPCGTAQERIEKTVGYLIKNGVILPPVTVGQTVYFMPDDEIFEAKVISIEINLFTNPRLWISLEYYSPIFGTCEYKSRVDLMLGKSVFLTREEAEAELERRRKEANTT